MPLGRADCGPGASGAPCQSVNALVLNFLQQPCHVLPQSLHGLNCLVILLNVTNLEPDADVPVRRAGHDHFADQKEVVQGIEDVDRPGPPHRHHRSATEMAAGSFAGIQGKSSPVISHP
jgi:hypothetical protein